TDDGPGGGSGSGPGVVRSCCNVAASPGSGCRSRRTCRGGHKDRSSSSGLPTSYSVSWDLPRTDNQAGHCPWRRRFGRQHAAPFGRIDCARKPKSTARGGPTHRGRWDRSKLAEARCAQRRGGPTRAISGPALSLSFSSEPRPVPLADVEVQPPAVRAEGRGQVRPPLRRRPATPGTIHGSSDRHACEPSRFRLDSITLKPTAWWFLPPPAART